MDVYNYDNVSGTILSIGGYTIPVGGEVVSNGNTISVLEPYVGKGLRKYLNGKPVEYLVSYNPSSGEFTNGFSGTPHSLLITNIPSTTSDIILSTNTYFTSSDNGKPFRLTFIEGNNWETRTGCVYTHSTATLTRGTLVDSSTGSAIALTAAAVVSLGATAAQATYQETIKQARLKVRHIEEFGDAVGGFWDAALAAAVTYSGTVGGLVLLFQGQQTYAFASNFPALPNDGQTAPSAYPFIMRGAGSFWNGRGKALYGSTVLDFQAAATYGKIALNTLGLFGLEDLTLTCSTATAGALVYTTNATLSIHRCAFVGTNSGLSATQDAIVLGGTTQVEGGSGWDDGFQGYGTVIDHNFFHKIKTCVALRAYCNAVVVSNNNVWNTCGNASGAPFIINGQAGVQNAVGNSFVGNLIEISYYAYGYMFDKASRNVISGGGFYDETVTSLAAVIFASTANQNFLTVSFKSAALTSVIDNGVNNYEDTANSGSQSFLKNPYKYRTLQIESTPGVIQFLTPAGATNAEFQANGQTWKCTYAGTGGNMLWDTGTGGSYADIKAYAVRHYSHGGTLVGTLSSTADGYRLAVPITFIPSSNQPMNNNGEMSFDQVSNTQIKLKFRGSDGVTRSTTFTVT